MARWQLQQAGRAEETHCRFCNSPLEDWKSYLTPDGLQKEVNRVQVSGGATVVLPTGHSRK